MKTEPIYVLLTDTRKIISAVIMAVTGESYNHVSIALEPDLVRAYSFSMGAGGFVEETPAVWPAHTVFKLFRIDVPEGGRERLMKFIRTVKRQRGSFSYVNLLSPIVKMESLPETKSMICAEFTDRALTVAGSPSLHEKSHFASPESVLKGRNAVAVDSGYLHQYLVKTAPILMSEHLELTTIEDLLQ